MSQKQSKKSKKSKKEIQQIDNNEDWRDIKTGFTRSIPTTEAPIQFVTVFKDRAEITRRIVGRTDLVGVQAIQISGFPSTVSSDSFRVSGGVGEIVLFEVSYENVLVERQEGVPDDGNDIERESLRNEVKAVIKEMEKEKYLIEEKKNRNKMVRDLTKEYIDNLMLLPTDSGLEDELSVERFDESLMYYVEKIEECDMKYLEWDKETRALKKEIEKKKNILSNIKKPPGVSIRKEYQKVCTIQFAAKEETDYEMDLSYLVNSASWQSSYNLRVDSAEQIGNIIYHGSISNSTGEKWENVTLTLSTAEPSKGGSPPVLQSLHVKIKPVFDAPKGKGMKYMPKAKRAMQPATSSINAPAPTVTTTEVDDTAFHATYTIPRLCTINDDGKEIKVTVAEIPLPMEFVHVASPNVTTDIFLRGTTFNKSKYTLLHGAMNVFMDNFFITQTELHDTPRNGKIEVFLGVDGSVKLEIFPDNSNKGEAGGIFTSKKKREATTHVSKITNNKDISINMLVLDQLPRPLDEKITVKIITNSLEEFTTIDDHNIVNWNFELTPRSYQQIEFGYEIEYAKTNYILIDKVYS